MTRVFDEKFEGTGYEETWSGGESVGSGSTVDEDADVADVSSPAGWDSQCLKLISTGNSCYVSHDPGNHTYAYWRMEIVMTAESFADGEKVNLFDIRNGPETDKTMKMGIRQVSGGDLKIHFEVDQDGGGRDTFLSDVISLDTLYRVEWKYDIANDAWEWRINDVTQDSGSLTSTHATALDEWFVGGSFQSNGHTTYIDNFAIDDADWIGSEVTAGGIIVLRRRIEG